MKKYLIISLTILLLMIFSTNTYKTHAKNYVCFSYVKPENNVKEDLYKELHNEVYKYIMSQAPNSNKDLSAMMIDASMKYDIDLCFMMAQTQIETNYGTTGAGRESSRKSLFGIARFKYSSYEEAIHKYCQLIINKYLVKDRTEQHLMKNFISVSGARYAKSLNYEHKLSKTYNNIKKSTNIYELRNKYKSMNS